MLRDSSLHSLGDAAEGENECLPMQMLHTLHCLPEYYNEADLQCHALTVTYDIIIKTVNQNMVNLNKDKKSEICQINITLFDDKIQLIMLRINVSDCTPTDV